MKSAQSIEMLSEDIFTASASLSISQFQAVISIIFHFS